MIYDDNVPVLENRSLTGGHFLLSVRSRRQAQATRPGQFAMIRLLGRSDVLLRRPMSIYDVKPCESEGERAISEAASPPGTGPAEIKPNALSTIQILYKTVGRGTR